MLVKEINLEGLEKWGEGASSEVFKDPNNPDIIIKLFFPVLTRENVYNEYKRSDEVSKLGINTPKVFEFIKHDDRYGIIYQRVTRKKSVSRAISDEPEKMEEYMKLFAESCKKLHATEAKNGYFPSIVDYYDSLLDRATFLKKEDSDKVRKFLHSIPLKTTAIHGDMHMGNVLLADGQIYWIDLGQFSFGNPIFDNAALFMLTNVVSRSPFIHETFHLSYKQMMDCWKHYVKYYYGDGSEEFLQKKNAEIIPYTIFFLLFSRVELGINRHFSKHFADLLKFIK